MNGEILNAIIHFGNPSLWLTLILLGTVARLSSQSSMCLHMPNTTGFIFTLLSAIMCRNAQENYFWSEENRQKITPCLWGMYEQGTAYSSSSSWAVYLPWYSPMSKTASDRVQGWNNTNLRQTCVCAHQVGTESQAEDQTWSWCLTAHRRSHTLVLLHPSCFKLLLIPLVTGESVCLWGLELDGY